MPIIYDKKGYYMETCWFCKNNKSDSTKAVVVPLYKTVDVESKLIRRNEFSYNQGDVVGINTKLTYVPAKILVPRCDNCAKTHARTVWFDILGGLFWALITVLAGITINSTYSHQDHTIFNSNAFMFCCLLPAWVLLFYLSFKLPRAFYLKAKNTLPLSDKKKYSKVWDLTSDGYIIGEGPGSPSDND